MLIKNLIYLIKNVINYVKFYVKDSKNIHIKSQQYLIINILFYRKVIRNCVYYHRWKENLHHSHRLTI